MAKKCKNCGSTVEDSVGICPNCNNLGFEETVKLELTGQQLQQLANLVSEDISKRPRFFWSVSWRVLLGLSTVLGIVGLITGLSIWSSFDAFKAQTQSDIEAKFKLLNETSSNQITRSYSDITNAVASKFQLFSKEADLKITSAYNIVTNQIANDFKTPRIEQTVEDVAKGQAKEILEKNVQPEVDKFRADAGFLRLAAQAQADDFKAYQKLLEIGAGTNENAYFAREVVEEIDRSLDQDRSYNANLAKRLFGEGSSEHFYKGPFTSDEIAMNFRNVEQDWSPDNREGFINTVADMNQPLFMSRLVDFLANETDLTVADRIAIAISQISGQDFHPRQYQQIMSWWRKNQNNFTNWPAVQYREGTQALSACKYGEALTDFEFVLSVDPKADKSRAFAVACAVETGDMTKAQQLGTGFAISDGRWTQWAQGKMMLATNAIKQGTEMFASISKKYPTMADSFIVPGNNILRQVDWVLFAKLTQASNAVDQVSGK